MDVNGRCQARFPLSIIVKVTRGNEVVGIQKHILYIISYKLHWVRAKNTIKWNSPFLLKDQRYFLLSRITAFGQSSGMKLLYLHARNALE